MKRKVLPLLVGVSLAGVMSVAAADVTLFGHIDTSIDAWNTDGAGHDIVLKCTTCSVGFKGNEDLGNGLSAIFKLDFQYDTTTAAGITDRDKWVGLAGSDFGKLRIGTISTLYKSHGAMIDPLYRTTLQGRDRGLQSDLHTGAGEELQGRATNTVRWDSPDYSGVKVGATYTIDSNKNDGEDDNPYGVGASYENGGLLVFGDYMNNGQSGKPMKAAMKVGGKYNMGMFSVMAQYEKFDDSSTWNDDQRVWQVAGGVNGLLGMNIYLGIAQGDNKDDSKGYNAWTLAVTTDLSKRTMLYTGYTEVNCDAGANNSNLGATFKACTVIGPSYTGDGYSGTFAVGMKMKF